MDTKIILNMAQDTKYRYFSVCASGVCVCVCVWVGVCVCPTKMNINNCGAGEYLLTIWSPKYLHWILHKPPSHSTITILPTASLYWLVSTEIWRQLFNTG